MTTNVTIGLTVGVVAIIAGLGLGYYFGYDRGFEKAIAPVDIVPEQVAAVPTNTPATLGATSPATGTVAGESTIDQRVVSARFQLVGNWQSEEDSAFFREYKADGTVVDSHDSFNEKLATPTTYTLFTADAAPEATAFQLNNNDVYIRHADNDEPAYFRIVKLNDTELEVVYMNRGGTLKFTRIK